MPLTAIADIHENFSASVRQCHRHIKARDFAPFFDAYERLVDNVRQYENSTDMATNTDFLNLMEGREDELAECLSLNDLVGRRRAMAALMKRIPGDLESLLATGYLTLGQLLLENRFLVGTLNTCEKVLMFNPGDNRVDRLLDRAMETGSKPSRSVDDDMSIRLNRKIQKIRRKYCFREDDAFWQRLKDIYPFTSVRCIDFDEEGNIYLNDVERAAVVKISKGMKLCWRVFADRWTPAHRDAEPWGFGSFSVHGGVIWISDFRSRFLVQLDLEGNLVHTIPLPLETPSFAQYAAANDTYHIPDETIGAITIFDADFNKIKAYRHENRLLKPVQILYHKEREEIFAAFGYRGIFSSIEIFDPEGRHLETFRTFDKDPTHVVKMDIDAQDHLYALDHYGRIYKMDYRSNLVWTFSENEIYDRFRYIKYHQDHLYISDAYTVRRFKVN